MTFVHSAEGKVMPNAKKGVLLGYPAGAKGYKVWLIEERKCVISRNVMFQENAVYKDVMQSNKEYTIDQKEPLNISLDIDLEEIGDMPSRGDLLEEI